VGKHAAFLDVRCEGDAALRSCLDALRAAHEQPETLRATQAKAARPTIKLDLTDAPDEAVGQTLGRCKLLERVGEGRRARRSEPDGRRSATPAAWDVHRRSMNLTMAGSGSRGLWRCRGGGWRELAAESRRLREVR